MDYDAFLNTFPKVIQIIKNTISTAENLRDFQESISRLALEGDLDEIYTRTKRTQEKIANYIGSGI